MTDSDTRIAALEAQVARLTAALEGSGCHEAESAPATFDRRGLLRRGGLAALAGVAGAAALPALMPGVASAADGDPMLVGRLNQGTASTRLTALLPGRAPLSVSNGAAATGPGQGLAAPVINLTPSDGLYPDTANTVPGDVTVAEDGLTYLTMPGAAVGAAPVAFEVFTGATASFLEFAGPFRALDTRGIKPDGSDGRAYIRSPASSFTPGGKLIGTQVLELDLSDFVLGGLAVLGNLTVTTPEGPGHLIMYPANALSIPVTSNLNYARGASVANFVAVGLSPSSSIRIYSHATAHVIFDFAAFSVFESFSVAQIESGAQVAAKKGPGRRPDRRSTRSQ